MNRFLLPGILVFALLLCTAVFSTATPCHSSDTPQSAEAVKARTKYEEECVKLDAEYAKKLNGLRQQYVKELDAVRKKTLEKDDLDEALRLLEEKKRVEAGGQPGMTKGLGILCALWGIENKWADVTPILRGAVQQSQLHIRQNADPLSAMSDIASGVHKTLDDCLYAGWKTVFVPYKRQRTG